MITTVREFAEELKKMISETHEENIKIQEINKNNGQVLTGIIIETEGTNIHPTLYVNGEFEEYLKGKDIHDCLHDILKLYEAHKMDRPFDVELLTDYEQAKDKIVYRVSNYEKNKETLQGKPHIEHLDLAITFHVVISSNEDATATAPVNNELMEKWGVTTGELLQAACDNTRRLFPERFMTMFEMISGMMPGADIQEDAPMFIATNESKNYGASVMLYNNFLQFVKDRIGQSFYVLPSSIHELIFIPESDAPTVEELKGLVTDVNQTQVAEPDILSDSVYFFDGELRIAA